MGKLWLSLMHVVIHNACACRWGKVILLDALPTGQNRLLDRGAPFETTFKLLEKKAEKKKANY